MYKISLTIRHTLTIRGTHTQKHAHTHRRITEKNINTIKISVKSTAIPSKGKHVYIIYTYVHLSLELLSHIYYNTMWLGETLSIAACASLLGILGNI